MKYIKKRGIESTKRLYNSLLRRQNKDLDILIKKLLSECPEFIREIPRQTPEYIRIALENDGTTIQYLREEPTAEYRKIAILNDPEAISLINNATEDEKKMAVTHNPNAVLYIEEPDISLIREALIAKPLLIGFFDNLDRYTKVIGFTSRYKQLTGLPECEIRKELKIYGKVVGINVNEYEFLFN